jgi:hypothetical protein
VLTPDEDAIIVALRRHRLLPLDDRLYALQPTSGLLRASDRTSAHPNLYYIILIMRNIDRTNTKKTKAVLTGRQSPAEAALPQMKDKGLSPLLWRHLM